MDQWSKLCGSGPIGRIGAYAGIIEPAWEAFRDDFVNLEELLRTSGSRDLSEGRNRNVMTILDADGRAVEIVVKLFGRQPAVKDCIDRARGSKAFRTWRAASHLQRSGVGTPAPVGFLDRWSRGRLLESCFISEYRPDAVSFKRELIRLFREDSQCWKFMNLLRVVAEAVAEMHESGFAHNDLGNQNILLHRSGDGAWGDVQFIDLNRGRIRARLSVRERARDISRIFLPSDLLRVFKHMYHGDQPLPEEFERAERFYRRAYAVHAATRTIRHPLRESRKRKTRRPSSGGEYPSPRDMWIWDERSAQPIAAMKSRDRSRHYSRSWIMKPVAAAAAGALPVRREYRRLMDECYVRPVPMDGTVGVAVDPKAESWEHELRCLAGLGSVPVIVRLYCHEDDEARKFRADAVKKLAAGGRPVSVALVQDRSAVLDPAKWRKFVDWVLDETCGVVEWVEAGHAINRVKWGVWTFAEHRRLMEAVADAVCGRRGPKLMGPAAIDFEYPFVMAALKNLPGSMRLSALSHHLYVDRRGAPENRQGSFDSLRKFALARAIARWAPGCDDRVIVSEVNWPLLGTGVYSPVGSPYEEPGPRFNDPSVSETDYAAYMLRYLAIAVCSGMVERVYWWRLAARGFGLADDSAPDSFVNRPAYRALKFFLETVGKATYRTRITDWAGLPAEGVHVLSFERDTGGSVYLAWSAERAREASLPSSVSAVHDMYGSPVGVDSSRIVLTGDPVYVSA